MQPPDGSHKCKNALRASLCRFFVNENYLKKTQRQDENYQFTTILYSKYNFHLIGFKNIINSVIFSHFMTLKLSKPFSLEDMSSKQYENSWGTMTSMSHRPQLHLHRICREAIYASQT